MIRFQSLFSLAICLLGAVASFLYALAYAELKSQDEVFFFMALGLLFITLLMAGVVERIDREDHNHR